MFGELYLIVMSLLTRLGHFNSGFLCQGCVGVYY